MRYDIFAERIDNFGDMAIALRLAEGLSTKKNPSRLFIKQDSLFLDFLKLQGKYNFELMNIEEIENNLAPAKVIISIFDAQIPHNYLNKIKQITQHTTKASGVFITFFAPIVSHPPCIKRCSLFFMLNDNSYKDRRF